MPIYVPKEKIEHSLKRFFMGNGIEYDDAKKAAKYLLSRDHKDLATLNLDYFNGKLGPKFLPPMFFSGIPKVANFKEYQDFYANKGEKGKYSDQIKGVLAEKFVFHELKTYYNDTKDDVLVVHNHQFLGSSCSNEKDFVIINLSKGYTLSLRSKLTQTNFKLQKSNSKMPKIE